MIAEDALLVQLIRLVAAFPSRPRRPAGEVVWSSTRIGCS